LRSLVVSGVKNVASSIFEVVCQCLDLVGVDEGIGILAELFSETRSQVCELVGGIDREAGGVFGDICRASILKTDSQVVVHLSGGAESLADIGMVCCIDREVGESLGTFAGAPTALWIEFPAESTGLRVSSAKNFFMQYE
jgi:hypothetical protein